MPSAQDPRESIRQHGAWSRSEAALLLGLGVFISCLLGIYTRSTGSLALIWPANALMLGLLIRIPASASAAGWLSGAAAFVLADLLTGASPLKAVILNAANLVGIGTAYALYRSLPPAVARLRDPASMLHLLRVAAVAAAAAGVVGGAANPILFQGSVWRGWSFWFATEFVNYIAILPVFLSAPSLRLFSATALRQALSAARMHSLMPAGALLLSCLVMALLGGPGAIAFPVPALLWCSLVYPVFPTTVLTLLSSLWALLVISNGYSANLANQEETLQVSLRLGASLVALVPIMLSCVMRSRNELLTRLQHLATHDPLTGVSSRSAFHEGARQSLRQGQGHFGVLMIDLDHFKQINDSEGHAAGDAVLIAVANRLRACLRDSDLLGRLGGEEFAVLLSDQTPRQLLVIAERLREAVAGSPVALRDGRLLPVTASIGVAITEQASADDAERLLLAADAALYDAKRTGRNRVALHPGSEDASKACEAQAA